MCFVLHCLSLLVLAIVLSDVNVRQYYGQNQQGQTILHKTHRRTSDNTMAKTNKDKQCYAKHIEELCDVLYITLFFLVGFGHGIV
jgi:predicted HAD superfamily Cof-like phosphohydrolase